MRNALLVGGFVLIGLAVALVPLPLYTLAPGGALGVSEQVDLAHPADDVSGRFLLTTVRLDRPAVAGAIAAWLDDSRAVVPRRAVVAEGVDDAEYFRAQRRLFTESTRLAAAVGLRAAGFDVTISGSGAQITAVLPGSPADGKLRQGDVLVAADGTPIDLAADLAATTSRASAGEVTTLTVRRGDEETTVRVELEEVSRLGRPGLGVAVRTVEREIVLPFDVEIDERGLGGPSAGLMVALTVYDLAAEGDLSGGRVVAGTGTIDATGRVGPVGGVEQKVAAAITARADLFLVPRGEVGAARDAAGDDLEVVPVTSLDDAIAALSRTP